MLIPSSAPLSARHPFTTPPPLPPPLVRFPELGVFMFCLPFWYFPHISSPFPSIPFHYYLYSPNEWDHIMFVLLRLTHFIQNNTLQVHPHWSKWWVFVISNVWARPTFSLSSSFESPMIWMLLIYKWLTSLHLSLWSITFLVFMASTWDCISVIAFLTLAWLDFSSFISTVRDSLVFFCALFLAQLLSL